MYKQTQKCSANYAQSHPKYHARMMFQSIHSLLKPSFYTNRMQLLLFSTIKLFELYDSKNLPVKQLQLFRQVLTVLLIRFRYSGKFRLFINLSFARRLYNQMLLHVFFNK